MLHHTIYRHLLRYNEIITWKREDRLEFGYFYRPWYLWHGCLTLYPGAPKYHVRSLYVGGCVPLWAITGREILPVSQRSFLYPSQLRSYECTCDSSSFFSFFSFPVGECVYFERVYILLHLSFSFTDECTFSSFSCLSIHNTSVHVKLILDLYVPWQW